LKLRNLALALVLAAPVMQLAAQETNKKTTEEKKEVTDPVCGMQVDPATSPKSTYKGKSYYFCSLSDKQEFDKAPTTYIKVDKKDTTKK
jgi:YHS domain-containing protein